MWRGADGRIPTLGTGPLSLLSLLRPFPSPIYSASNLVMAQSLIRATCRCSKSLLARSALYSATACPLRRNFASSPAARDEPLPWFVDPSSLPAAPTSSPKLATAPVPTPPPAHLDQHLHPLHNHLSISPFLDKQSLVYINAREADPESTWVDWVVVASLRKGREGGLRGAIEGVRTFVSFGASSAQMLQDVLDLLGSYTYTSSDHP